MIFICTQNLKTRFNMTNNRTHQQFTSLIIKLFDFLYTKLLSPKIEGNAEREPMADYQV